MSKPRKNFPYWDLAQELVNDEGISMPEAVQRVVESAVLDAAEYAIGHLERGFWATRTAKVSLKILRKEYHQHHPRTVPLQEAINLSEDLLGNLQPAEETRPTVESAKSNSAGPREAIVFSQAAEKRGADAPMALGERIRQLGESKNMTQGDIEHRSGLLRCYISRVEKGHTVPSVETLEKIARAMDIHLYELFFDCNKGEPKELCLTRNAAKGLSSEHVAQ